MKKGFTLIELLVVIAIIAVLATVVFVALNPAQRFADARDSRRANDVNNILTALHECVIDNEGSITTCGFAAATQAEAEIGTCVATESECPGILTACVNLEADTDLNPYLASFPIDPGTLGSAANTGYTVTIDTNGIFTVKACHTEGDTIQVSR